MDCRVERPFCQTHLFESISASSSVLYEKRGLQESGMRIIAVVSLQQMRQRSQQPRTVPSLDTIMRVELLQVSPCSLGEVLHAVIVIS